MYERITRLRKILAGKELDALLVSQPENRYYLSGFDGSDGYLLISADKVILATDFRYIEQAKAQSPDFTIFQIKNSLSDWFPELITSVKGTIIGIESGSISVAAFRQMTDALKKCPTVKLVPTEGLVEALRIVKEPAEIAFISRAAEIGDKAVSHIMSIMQPGMTEKEVAWELEKFLREHGSETVPFDIIVASGPQGALPHARPTDRVLQAGKPIVLDLGARVASYSSDLTRTVCLGKPDATFLKIYDIVLGAQLTALAIIREGMTGAEADSLARTVITEAGYGEAFGHALGHGVGLATHEAPRLGARSEDKLTSGMVFTVEPGIYLPGWGGVRIEDLVVMADGRPSTISKAEKINSD